MSETYRLPDGPKTPELFNGLSFLLFRNRVIRKWQRRYGDTFSVRMPGFGLMVLVSTPDQVKQVYTAKADVLHGGKNPLGEILGPGSLFSMDEEQHLKERRMLLPPFHGERMRSYETIIEEEAECARWASWPEGVEFAAIESFQSITLRIILRTVFGAEGRELAELEKLLPPMTTIGQRLVTAPFLRRDLGRRSPGGRWRRMHAEYRVLVDKLVDDHLADPDLDERIDILAMMLRALPRGGRRDRSFRRRRRAPHPAGRRPRDHRLGALLVGRAPAPPSRDPAPTRRRGARRRRTRCASPPPRRCCGCAR